GLPKASSGTGPAIPKSCSPANLALRAGLQLPSGDDCVLHGIAVPVLEVGDDHHVLREARRYGEGLGKRLEQEVPEVERRTNGDGGPSELPRDQAPPVPPVEQTVAAPLDDALELSGQTADVCKPHQAMRFVSEPRYSVSLTRMSQAFTTPPT